MIGSGFIVSMEQVSARMDQEVTSSSDQLLTGLRRHVLGFGVIMMLFFQKIYLNVEGRDRNLFSCTEADADIGGL